MKEGADDIQEELRSNPRAPSLTRQGLIRVRRKSMRRGIWFRVLNALERGIVKLTIRCVEKVKSQKLTWLLMSVIGKVSAAMKSRFLKKAEMCGRPLAHKIAQWACSWGNPNACNWVKDVAFVTYVGALYLSGNISSSIRMG